MSETVDERVLLGFREWVMNRLPSAERRSDGYYEARCLRKVLKALDDLEVFVARCPVDHAQRQQKGFLSCYNCGLQWDAIEPVRERAR